MQQTNAIIKRVWLTMALLPLTFTSAAAQYFGHISLASSNDAYQYFFAHIASDGYSCTASVIEQDLKAFTARLIFERSDDGGRTWRRQDPALPPLLGTLNSSHIINAISQIDSLNVIAVGDSGLVIRTYDAGQTWHVQYTGTKSRLQDVHFSDPLNGVIVASGPSAALTTSDGGNNWTTNALHLRYYPASCHTTGSGRYQVFAYGYGPVYSTTDNWQHVDSTSIIIDSAERSRKVLAHCNFAGDTLIASGTTYAGSQTYALICRSTNGGFSWKTSLDSDSYAGNASSLSRIDQDTIIAASGAPNQILVSYDNGQHWSADTLLLDTTDFQVQTVGAALLSSGHIVVVLDALAEWFAFGERTNSSVKLKDQDTQVVLYPNPASQLIHANSLRSSYLFDALGRNYKVANHEGTLDISTLPPGVYYVSVGKQRARFVKE